MTTDSTILFRPAEVPLNGKWCIYIATLSKALYIDLHSPIQGTNLLIGSNQGFLLKDSSTPTLRESGIKLGILREPSVF